MLVGVFVEHCQSRCLLLKRGNVSVVVVAVVVVPFPVSLSGGTVTARNKDWLVWDRQRNISGHMPQEKGRRESEENPAPVM